MEQRFVKDIEWMSFNRDTYELIGVEPLSEGFRPSFDRRFRIAIVSLFSMESLGVRALYAFMKEAGFEIDAVFLKEHALNNFKLPTEAECRILINLLHSRNIRLVGIAVRSPYLAFARDLTGQIHQELNIPVVWGGTAATVTPDLCIKGGADYAVCGEGEMPFAELVNAIASGDSTSTIKNVWYRGADGKAASNPNRRLIRELDRLPMQDLEDGNKFAIEFGRLTEGEPLRNWVRFETLAARGCPYKCSYCINSYLIELNRGLGKPVNSASVEHLICELEYARTMLPKMSAIFFVDEIFGVSINWTRKFREQYVKRINLQFECQADLRTLNETKIKLLEESGLVEMDFGIQSGSETTRREIYDRPISDERLFQVIHLLQKYGVEMRYDIIADNPLESSEDKRATLHFLLQLPRPFILNMYSLNYFPKTKLTLYALEKGVIDETDVAGYSEKCLSQFTVSFDYPRSDEDKFWNALYAMSSKWFIPRRFLHILADSERASRHPLPLVILARITSMIQLFCDGFVLLWKRRISWDTVRRFSGSIGSIAR